MDRRSFLSRSAFTTGALAIPGLGSAIAGSAIAGCGAAPARPELGALETAVLAERLTTGLRAVREHPPGELLRAAPWHLRPEVSETALRLGLEGLVIADVARAVPAGTTVPRALAEVLQPELPTMLAAVAAYTTLLERTPPIARRQMDLRLRDYPDAALDVAAWVDQRAGNLGVESSSRLDIRQTASGLTVRARRQSMSAVIDDCLGKVERVRARTALSLSPSAATAAMIDAVWQTVDGTGSPGATPAPPSSYVYTDPASPSGVIITPAADPTLPASDGRWSERWASPGDPEIEYGAIMMALCPVGPPLLIVGLILIIVGCVQNGEWDGTPHPSYVGH